MNFPYEKFGSPDVQRIDVGRGAVLPSRRADGLVRRALGVGPTTATVSALVCALTVAGMVKASSMMNEVRQSLDAAQQASTPITGAHACQEDKTLSYCLPLRLRDGSMRMVRMQADGNVNTDALGNQTRLYVAVLADGVSRFHPVGVKNKRLDFDIPAGARIVVMNPSGHLAAAERRADRSLDLTRTVPVDVPFVQQGIDGPATVLPR